ncbi:MAG: class III signal peptide-containing protein [Methanobrevibacter sp.]|nr:class III signal peptide-containing protein [Methanobrevibacter sp.]
MSANELEIFESGKDLIRIPKETVFESIKRNFVQLKEENSGQGAAEYILLFGGVIVIALAGLLIYRSYFSNNTSGLNATQDINSIRDNMSNVL